MSTAEEVVSVEPVSDEKPETKEVKGTKRAAEVSIRIHYRQKPKLALLRSINAAREKKKILISDSIIDTPQDEKMLSHFSARFRASVPS